MPSIKNHRVLIFGGTSGIGYGVADKSLSEGAIVHISSSNASKVSEAASSLKAKYPESEVTGHVCDLSVDDVETHLENLLTEIGQLDHIVYTAGDTLATKPLDSIDITSIQKAGHIRFTVPLLLSKLALRFLKPGYQSSLILTTGAVSQKPLPNWSLIAGYATGLHGLVRNLAVDMKPLRVNLVSPGAIKTPLLDDEIHEQFASYTTLGKIGSMEEIAEAYVYLMKDTNATGSCVSSNAGWLLV